MCSLQAFLCSDCLFGGFLDHYFPLESSNRSFTTVLYPFYHSGRSGNHHSLAHNEGQFLDSWCHLQHSALSQHHLLCLFSNCAAVGQYSDDRFKTFYYVAIAGLMVFTVPGHPLSYSKVVCLVNRLFRFRLYNAFYFEGACSV